MHGFPVLPGINNHIIHAKVTTGINYAEGYLTSVGNEYSFFAHIDILKELLPDLILTLLIFFNMTVRPARTACLKNQTPPRAGEHEIKPIPVHIFMLPHVSIFLKAAALSSYKTTLSLYTCCPSMSQRIIVPVP
jgi:hypothetical protein